MARFVIFPGTAGSYADTPDTNLLDADTANVQQSTGGWKRDTNQPTQLSTVMTPLFGTFHGVLTNATAGQKLLVLSQPVYTDAFPVTPGVSYTFSGNLAGSEAMTGVRVDLRWLDAAGGTISTEFDTGVDVGALTWQGVSNSGVAPALAAFMDVRFVSSFVASTSELYFDAHIVRADSVDTSFVPSLDIVGTLFEAFNSTPDDPPIAYAADGTPLTVGVSWAGNLYTYSRHDGADASAPIVAIFDAEDIGL